MPDYKEQNLNAKTWQRARFMHITNAFGHTPNIQFFEEQRVLLPDGETFAKDVGSAIVQFDGPKTFPLIDPISNQPIGGTATHQDLQVLLYSLYVATCQERDAANVPPENPV